MKVLLTVIALATMGSYAEQPAGEWVSLFSGSGLDGWIPKVKGYPPGENPWNLFRVEDGMLTVSYADYPHAEFQGEFGHLFTVNTYTNYRFRCEYRFIGKQVAGAPKWAYANNGIMLHCPHPNEMKIDQSFPDSAEFQLLGDTRTTGSLFTPGCMVEHNGAEIKKSVKSILPSCPLGEWVKAEAIVKDGTIQHWINGELVMEYSNPRYDDGTPMTSGHIALQAESHPCQFRNIEIQILD